MNPEARQESAPRTAPLASRVLAKNAWRPEAASECKAGLAPRTNDPMAELANLLRSSSDRQIVQRLLKEVPWIFEGDAGAFVSWRDDIASAVGCSSASIHIVGSAALGFSLSPTKPGRPFRRTGSYPEPPSDIDVVLVCETLFTKAWDALREREQHGWPSTTRDARDKVRTDVYWGFVTSPNLPLGTQPAMIVRGAMARTTLRPPFRGHSAKARIYRKEGDLVAYHVQSLRALRKETGNLS